MSATRVILYARGIPAEVQHQHAACLDLAQRLGYTVVGVASDGPGESRGWHSANRMLRDGEVDRILVESRRVTPLSLDSITAEMPGRRPRRLNE